MIKKHQTFIFLKTISINIILIILINPIKVIENLLTNNSSNLYVVVVLISYFLPIFLVNIYLIGELNFSPFSTKSQFLLAHRFCLFSKKFNVYCSVFECSTVDSAQFDNFDQFVNFYALSIEFLRDKGVLRIFVFDNSLENLIERITKLKPVVETILPGICLLSSNIIRNILTSYFLVRIGNIHIIENNKKYFIPVNHSTNDRLIHNTNRIVFYNSLFRDNKNHECGTIQIYYFQEVSISDFFKFYGDRIYYFKKHNIHSFNDANLISKAIFRLRLDHGQNFEYSDGIKILKNYISSSIIEFNDIYHKNEKTSVQSSLSLIQDKNTSENNDLIRYNQVCVEICNIFRNEKNLFEKRDLFCQKRSELSRKLLANDNFVKLISKLTEIPEYKDKKGLFRDLIKNLAFQQIYCLLAHLFVNKEIIEPDRNPQSLLIDLLHYKQENRESKLNVSKKIKSNTDIKRITSKKVSI
jgi:hypothetical protein